MVKLRVSLSPLISGTLNFFPSRYTMKKLLFHFLLQDHRNLQGQ